MILRGDLSCTESQAATSLPPASRCLTVFPPALTLSHSSFTFPVFPSVHPFLILPLFYTVLSPACLFTNFLSILPLCCLLSHTLPHFLLFSSVIPTSSALRSCSTGDSLLSSAFIRSAKSAPALAPPLPVLLHHHHPLLPPLADQLAGTLSLHYLSAWKL